MKIESLRYFIELSRSGSFHNAARNLFISQQGLSKSISALERELETELVERSRAGVRLTADGEVLLRRAIGIVGEYDGLVADLLAQRTDAVRSDPITLRVSYYGAQIAASAPGHVKLLANSSYLEEPFEKLIGHALASDGSDLNFLDIHPHSRADIEGNPDLAFDPVLETRYGFAWKEGSPLAVEKRLHRGAISNLPVALNSFREIAQLSDRLFADHPLSNVRMRAANPEILLEYVQTTGYGIAMTDSFSFHLAERNPSVNTERLHFTPLDTPDAVCKVGFLRARHVKQSMRARNAVATLKRYIQEHYPDYPGLVP